MSAYKQPETPLEFNMTGKRAPCLLGNWWNDRVLIKDGYNTRVYGLEIMKQDTFERVMPNCRSAKTMQGAVSKMVEDMTAVVRAPAKGKPLPPPRLSAAQKEIEEEAIAYVKALREPKVEFFERKTAMQEQFPFYGSDAYKSRAPAHKGGHPSSVQLDPEETKRPEAPPPLASAGNEFNIQPNTAIYESGWYGSDPVVSEFTTRLRFKTGGPSSATALSGVELSVLLLFSRLVKRCLDAKLDLGAFVSALEVHSTEEEGGEKFVLAKKMRALAHAVRLPLPDGDLEAIIMLCGKGEGEGIKVNLHALTGHIMSVNI